MIFVDFFGLKSQSFPETALKCRSLDFLFLQGLSPNPDLMFVGIKWDCVQKHTRVTTSEHIIMSLGKT